MLKYTFCLIFFLLGLCFQSFAQNAVFGKMEASETQLKWECLSGTQPGTLTVEHLEYKSWISKGTVKLDHKLQQDSSYTYNIHPFSKENKYRIKHVDTTGWITYSYPLDFNSIQSPVLVQQKREDIIFSRNTEYSVMNDKGFVLQENYGARYTCSTLQEGKYFLYFDGQIKKVTVGNTKKNRISISE